MLQTLAVQDPITEYGAPAWKETTLLSWQGAVKAVHLQLLRRCSKGHGSDQLSVDALCTAVTMPLCSFGQACTCRHKYHLQPAVPCCATATATNEHLRQADPRKTPVPGLLHWHSLTTLF